VEVTDPQEADERFAHVWQRARALFSCSWRDPESEVQPPQPRLFGGFAFRNGFSFPRWNWWEGRAREF
jgi:hypothetical protein